MGMTTFENVELSLQIIFNFDIQCRPRVTDSTIAASTLCVSKDDGLLRKPHSKRDHSTRAGTISWIQALT
jgi:hypothetical protein